MASGGRGKAGRARRRAGRWLQESSISEEVFQVECGSTGGQGESCFSAAAESRGRTVPPRPSPSESTVGRGREAPEVAFCRLTTQLRRGNEHTQGGARKLTLVRDSGVEEAGAGAPGKWAEWERGVR